ncbi:hypothetical protein pEaSNUABM6_00127 [Erwinia phage pEa_SNUABM_6]|nr:hypothetical protein pEaSNUABM6_00127 [Erwinia phage pEa_SNUABM_6]
MSSPSLIDVRDELSSHDYLIRMQSAFQKPLGGPTEARQVYAQVIGVDNKEVHFTNLETKLDFTMPLNVFLFVPAIGLSVEISRVHHRIFCWPDAHRENSDPIQLQIRL